MSKITNQSSVTSKYTLPDQSVKEATVQSNISTTEYMTTSFTKVRSTGKDYATPGEEVTQTLVLTNQSEYTITDVKIKDTLGEGATFVENSLTIDGEAQSFDPVTGFNLTEDIAAQEAKTISYKVKISDDISVENIETKSTITYSVNEITDLEEDSNTVLINVSRSVLTIKKTSDKTAVIKGQKLLFQNVIKNEGNVENTDVVFKDPIPVGTQFVEGSVKIDNVVQADYNPEQGFSLQNLAPNDEVTVTFEVTIL